MGGKVYIVEDDEAVRESLKLLLEFHDLDVQEYDSAEAFVRDYRKDGAGCLVIDQHMPGMTGLDLVELLQRNGNSLPTVLVTGRSDATIKARAKAAGIFAFLEKPVSESRLLPAIQQGLTRP